MHFPVLLFLLSSWDSHDTKLDFCCSCYSSAGHWGSVYIYLFICICWSVFSLFRLSKFSWTTLRFTDSVPSCLLSLWAHSTNFLFLRHHFFFLALWWTFGYYCIFDCFTKIVSFFCNPPENLCYLLKHLYEGVFKILDREFQYPIHFSCGIDWWPFLIQDVIFPGLHYDVWLPTAA